MESRNHLVGWAAVGCVCAAVMCFLAAIWTPHSVAPRIAGTGGVLLAVAAITGLAWGLRQ